MIESVRIIGRGRAGSSLAMALGQRGVDVEVLDRHALVGPAAADCDVLVVATPDPVIAEVAAAVRPVPDTVVIHLAGSLGLDVLARHPRRGSLHPLVAMPETELGAKRLSGAWFAVAGDPAVVELAELLDGRTVEVDDADRVRYHTAAVIASNHLVALMGQVERIAATAGVPFEAFVGLVRATVDNVADLGPAAALTGPVERGDWETVTRHLLSLDLSERTAYDVMANEARKLTFPQPQRYGFRNAEVVESGDQG